MASSISEFGEVRAANVKISQTPVNPTDAATVNYVNSVAGGATYWRESVIAFYDLAADDPAGISTGQKYISTTTGGAFVIDRIYTYTGVSRVYTEVIPADGYALYVSGLSKPYIYSAGSWRDFVQYNMLAEAGKLVIKYDDANYATLQVDATGDLEISTVGGDTTFAETETVRILNTASGSLIVSGGASVNGIMRNGVMPYIDVDPIIRVSNPIPDDKVIGDRYIAGATTGGWTIDNIYEWDGAAWIETVAQTYMRAYDLSENSYIIKYPSFWQTDKWPAAQTIAADSDFIRLNKYDGGESSTLIYGNAGNLYVSCDPGDIIMENRLIANSSTLPQFSIGLSGTYANFAYNGGSVQLDKILNITSTVDSAATNGGALIVAGGVGIAKNTNIGGYARIASTEEVAGTAAALMVSGGAIVSKKLRVDDATVYTTNTGTGSLVCAGTIRGPQISVDSTADSVPSNGTVGALFTRGGARINKRLYVGSADATTTNTTTGALVVVGGAQIAGISRFTNNTASINTSTGALILSGGGLGVAGAINAGGASSITAALGDQLSLYYDGPHYATHAVDSAGAYNITTYGGVGAEITISAGGPKINFAANNALNINSDEDAASTSTGSIRTLGGIGAQKSVRAASFVANAATNQFSILNGSYNSFISADVNGVLSISAGAGAVNINSTATITSTSANQMKVAYDGTTYAGLSVSSAGYLTVNTTGSGVNIASTTDSTSTNTGALIVSGGLACAKKLAAPTCKIDATNYTLDYNTVWLLSPSANESAAWVSLVYAGGMYVAVAADGDTRVMTSVDGKTWTIVSHFSANAEPWQDITYGDGFYVAVSALGNYGSMRAVNPTAWDANYTADYPSNPRTNWNGICYAAGLFVAVGSTGVSHRVMTSPNGASWTGRTPPAVKDWTAICYGTLFAACASNNTGTENIMTSSNAIDWTMRTTPAGTQYRGIAYGGGVYVAIANAGAQRVLRSTDGTTWTPYNSANDTILWQRINYIQSVFIATGLNGAIMTSTDGIVWKLSYAPAAANWSRPVLNTASGLIASISSNNAGSRTMSLILSETALNVVGDTTTYGKVIINDATASTSQTSGALVVSGGIGAQSVYAASISASGKLAVNSVENAGTTTTTGALIVAGGVRVGADLRTPITSILQENYETVWTGYAVPVANYWVSLAYGEQGFVAVARDITNADTYRIMISPDGVNWTKILTPSAISFTSVAYGGGLYMAIAETGTFEVITSQDGGRTWLENASDALANALWSAVVSNGTATTFVAVARSSTSTFYTARTSNGGVTWTGSTSLSAGAWSSVAYGASKYVAVATSGTYRISSSSDGNIWASTVQGNAASFSHVIFANSLFVAVGSAGGIFTSSDANVWVERTTTGALDFSSVAYGNGIFIAISSTTSYAVSKDGITWTTYAGGIGGYTSVAYGAGKFVAVSPTHASTRAAIISASKRNITSAGDATFSGMLRAGSSNVNTQLTVDGGASIGGELRVESAYSAVGTNRGSLNVIGGAKIGRDITVGSLNTPGGSINSVVSVNGHLVAYDYNYETTTVASGINSEWIDVAYGNGIFVAVADKTTNNLMYSRCGKVWSATGVSGVPANKFKCICFGGGKFVAIAKDTALAAVSITSADGIAWTGGSTMLDATWSQVVYGDGIYMASTRVVVSSNNITTSVNGISWTNTYNAGMSDVNGLCYGKGLFIVGGSGAAIRRSADAGVSWTSSYAGTGKIVSIAYGNGVFSAVTDNSTNTFYSANGVSWSAATTIQMGLNASVRFGNGLFVSTGDLGINTSINAISYTRRRAFPTFAKSTIRAPVYGCGTWVMVDYTAANNLVYNMDSQRGALTAYGASQLSAVQTEDLTVLSSARVANLSVVSDDYAGSTTLTTTSLGDLTIDASGNDINFHSTDAVRVLNTTTGSALTGALVCSGDITAAKSVRLSSSLIIYQSTTNTTTNSLTTRASDGLLVASCSRSSQSNDISGSAFLSNISSGLPDCIDIVTELPTEGMVDGDRYIFDSGGRSIQQWSEATQTWVGQDSFRMFTTYVINKGLRYIRTSFNSSSSDWQAVATLEMYRRANNTVPAPFMRMHYANDNVYSTVDMQDANNLSISHSGSSGVLSLNFPRSVLITGAADAVITNSTVGSLIVSGGVRVVKSAVIDTTLTVVGNSTFAKAYASSTEDITATNTTTGSLRVAGGCMIIGDTRLKNAYLEDYSLANKFYGSTTQTVNLSGPWTSAKSCTITLVRVGKLITITFPLTSGLGDTGFPSVITSQALSAGWRPAATSLYSVMVINDGLHAPGALKIETSGVMTIYIVDLTSYLPFPTNKTVGCDDTTISFIA